MRNTNAGGPAFPQVATDPDGDLWQPGMTLRDYFAAKAIAGILANPDISASAARCNVSTNEFREDTAIAAYAMADAMLKAREA